MGIKQLSSLLKKEVPSTLGTWRPAQDYSGEIVAIDASPCLYQCLTTSSTAGQDGDVSHIFGVLRRTVKLLELGITPIFIFDGEAPNMKKDGALSQRAVNRARSREQLADALRSGDPEAIRRFSVRLVKTTQQHNDEAMELLGLMGVPCIQAPSEAESFCSALASAGRATAVATEDFDALAFGAPRTLRYLHQAVAQPAAKAVQEICLMEVLAGLGYSHEEFVDLCILCGCDYLGNIHNVGPRTAHKLLSQHRSIEQVLSNLDHSKYKVPETWEYKAARECFRSPFVGDVTECPTKLQKAKPKALHQLLTARYKMPKHQAEDYISRLVTITGSAREGASAALEAVATRPFKAPRKAEPQASSATSLAVPRPVATPMRAGRSISLQRGPAAKSETDSTDQAQMTLQASLAKVAAKRCFEDSACFEMADTCEGIIAANQLESAAKQRRMKGCPVNGSKTPHDEVKTGEDSDRVESNMLEVEWLGAADGPELEGLLRSFGAAGAGLSALRNSLVSSIEVWEID